MKVPEEILKLIQQGKWKAKSNCPLQSELKDNYGWCGLIDLSQGPDFSDGGILEVSKNVAKDIYGVYLTGEFIDNDKLDHLDGDKCIMIACNYDEEAICLDFRFSSEEPRIMASDYSKNLGRWVEIAHTIDELIEKLGIKN